MKKFLVTILALVYLTSTVGASVRLDCCLEKLVLMGLGMSTHESQWQDDGTGNCKDDHKQARLGHEQKRTDSKIRVAKIVLSSLRTDQPANSFGIISNLLEKYRINRAPPQKGIVPLFILHCVHRI